MDNNLSYTESANALYASGTIGDSTGSGTYINQGFSVTFNGPGGLDLGSYPGGTGTVDLNTASPRTGTITVDYSEIIGDQGAGTFYQGGGTNAVTDNLLLGNTSGVTGAYNQSCGYLSVGGTEYVGYSGTGAFTQSGGTNAVTGDLQLSCNAGSSGTYNLSGGNLLVSGNEVIGGLGTGTFTQSGGTNTVAGALFLGYNTGASGTYTLSGGNEYVGINGAGTFTQSGGINAVHGLAVGAASGSGGTYTLNGGGLLAVNEYVGYSGTGTFTQTGGTNTVAGVLHPGPAGYTLSGGVLAVSNVSGNLYNNSGIVNIGLPGASSGTTLNIIGGNYTQYPSGTLDITIFSATSFDHMVVSGAANLSGKADLIVPGVYLPSGTVFQIITAGSISGTLTPRERHEALCSNMFC